MFAVVHFEEEDCVESVPLSWIDGGKCYWPLKDAKKKIKNNSMPDKENWTTYKIRRLGRDYENYETASKYCKKAEETSNFETDEDTRKRKKPSRFCSSESDIADDESETQDPAASFGEIPTPPRGYVSMMKEGASQQKEKRKKLTPSPRSPSPRSPSPRQDLVMSNKSVRSPRTMKRIGLQLHNQPPKSSRQTFHHIPHRQSSGTPLKTSTTFIRRSPRSKTSTPIVRLFAEESPTLPSQSVIRPACQPTPTYTESNNVSEVLQMILSKLEALENNVKALKDYIIPMHTDVESLDEFLPSGEKLNSVQDIRQFEEGIDENGRRKLVNSLASLTSGSNGGEICRKIMRALLTNHVMSQYSGSGQKGKLAFVGTPLYKIILSAARKASKKMLSFEEIKAEILDVLRNAPNKPGGTNYVKKTGSKKRKHREEENPPEDSD